MDLQDLWFIAIALLWTGYFFLEGFDFGVGTLLPVLGRAEDERRALISTIGPVWDGNEVWLIVAAGATFASFPLWYATLFSGFYLPLLVILVALILRGVAFEYRGKVDSTRWRTNWDRAILFGSVVPAVLWGFVFGNIIRGVPVNADFDYAGGVRNLLNIYSLVGGLTTLTLFLVHGALFIALKTAGDIEVRARQGTGRPGSCRSHRGLPGLDPGGARQDPHRSNRPTRWGRAAERAGPQPGRPGAVGVRPRRVPPPV
jgi:cytochrome d ubiquinol oxidase subunit II